MPKIGEYTVPNYGIEKICDLIIEVGRQYKNLDEGIVSEETFQKEIIRRKGGAYTAYKFDLGVYGFIERISRGQIRITKLFIDVANPIREEDRIRAKTEAVRNVRLLREIYEDGFTDSFSKDDLRIWLVEKKGVSRSEIDENKLDLIRKLYIEAYPYFKREKEVSGMEKTQPEITQPQLPVSTQQISQPVIQPTQVAPEEEEELKLGNIIRITFPKDNVETWKRVKKIVDIYLGIEETEKVTESKNKEQEK